MTSREMRETVRGMRLQVSKKVGLGVMNFKREIQSMVRTVIQVNKRGCCKQTDNTLVTIKIL